MDCLLELDAKLMKSMSASIGSVFGLHSSRISLSSSTASLSGTSDTNQEILALLKGSVVELLPKNTSSYSSLFHDPDTLDLVKNLLSKIHSAILLGKSANKELTTSKMYQLMENIALPLFNWLVPFVKMFAGDASALSAVVRTHDRGEYLESIERSLLTIFGLTLEDILIDGIPLSQINAFHVQKTQSVYISTDSSTSPELLRELVKSGRKKCTNLDFLDTNKLALHRHPPILFSEDLVILSSPSFLYRTYESPFLAYWFIHLTVFLNELFHREIVPFLASKYLSEPFWLKYLRKWRFQLRPLAYYPNLIWLSLAFLLFIWFF